MLAVLDNWGQQHEYRYNNNNNNNKPSSSTAQQRGKPPHCVNYKKHLNDRDTSISSAAPARQKYRNEKQYKYT